MIFKNHEHECYVYITLPKHTQPITAGKYILSLNRNQMPIGKFYYGKNYLAHPDAVPIDPFHLPLTNTIYETIELKGMFGALLDAGPDYWGRRIIEKNCGKIELNDIDYLLYAPDDHAGALNFGLNKMPPAPKRLFNKTIDLAKLQVIADQIVKQLQVEQDADSKQIADLMLLGTSMGGARPKTVVEDKDGLWIAKFNIDTDRWNQARVEHSMLQLAKKCGINAAESKVVNVGNKEILLVKRFDREKVEDGYLRARMLSAFTVLSCDESYSSREKWSYVILSEELRKISEAPEADALELFKRMCFNALISNTDDHPRNHAFIAKDKAWRLSPAYDLTPTAAISIERRDLAMICGDLGRIASKNNLMTQHGRFLLDKDQASHVINRMESQVKSEWYSVARASGVTDTDCKKIAAAFAYSGFSS